MLGRAMMGEQTVDELTGGSGDETYTFDPDATTSGPLLILNVKSQSADGALGLAQAVLNRAPTVLRQLQVEVKAPANSLVTMSVIAQDSTAQADRKSQSRALIVALAVGLALTVLLTTLLDTVIRRRSRRRFPDPPHDPSNIARQPTKRTQTEPQDVHPVASRARAGLRPPSKPVGGRVK